MQNQNNTNPMETGSIPKLLAQLAIPAVVAQVINLLYNIVDKIGRASCRERVKGRGDS